MSKKEMGSEEEIVKRETDDLIKNYSRIANMLVDGYPDLMPQEKWLYVCLKRLCGKEGNRFLSLRYISERTGFSMGALSASKKTGSPGMLWRLHQAGLLHVEIKKHVGADGKEKRQAQFHITVTDVWQKNYDFFYSPKCSKVEQSIEDDRESVRKSNSKCSEVELKTVQSVRKSSPERSEVRTIVRLQDKITDKNKITEEEATLNCSSSQSEQSAAARNNFVFESITEEEIALIQAYRQNSLQGNLPLSENLGGSEADQPSKQAEGVLQADEQSAVEVVPAEVPVASSDEVPTATIVSDGPAPFVRPAAVETAEEVVQLWEYVRQVRYGERERVAQLRAATVLLGMELPQPRTPDLLETLYATYYDDHWKHHFGEMHVTHLVGVEKSSGQVRVIRWINRLGIQALPTQPRQGAGARMGEEPSKPTMDFANYPQEKRDPVQEYLDGTLDTSRYPPKMLEVLKRHAAERRAVVAQGENQ